MNKLYLSVPLAVDLTNENKWQTIPGNKYSFFVVRCHFVIHKRQVAEPVRTGEKIAVFSVSRTGAGPMETQDSIEFNHSKLLIEEAIKSSLREEQSLYGFVENLSVGVEAGIGKLSNDLQVRAETTLKRSITNSYRIQSAETKEIKVKRMVTQTFTPSKGENIVAVETYQRYAYEIFLHYYDYLLVEYRTSLMGLRKKRVNLPRPERDKHTNRVLLNYPVGTALAWELLDGSVYTLPEDDYKNEVADPYEIEISELKQKFNQPLPTSLYKPTLYQISVATFPLRWIKRKSSEWTEEELKQIEFEEAEGSSWWFEYGPGRKKRKK